MVQTVAAGFDIDAQEQALHRIETAFASARQRASAADPSTAAQARLIETGPPVFAVRTRARMKSDVARLSLIAAALVSAILLFAYRSARMLVLALLPVLSGVLAGIAAVSLAFGFVHGITLGFGVTLIGEAVDYAIYLFTQTAPGAAPAATLSRIWPTLRLGMLTSVCGFSAMLLSSFTGFAQLGLFTITGLVVALAVTRWVLPMLLPHGFATTSSARLRCAGAGADPRRRQPPLRRAWPCCRRGYGSGVSPRPVLGRRTGEHEPAARGGKVAGRAVAPRDRRARRPLPPGRAGAGP